MIIYMLFRETSDKKPPMNFSASKVRMTKRNSSKSKDFIEDIPHYRK